MERHTKKSAFYHMGGIFLIEISLTCFACSLHFAQDKTKMIKIQKWYIWKGCMILSSINWRTTTQVIHLFLDFGHRQWQILINGSMTFWNYCVIYVFQVSQKGLLRWRHRKLRAHASSLSWLDNETLCWFREKQFN